MIVSPDRNGKLDGPVHFILKELKTDIPLVPVTFYQDYQFDQSLYWKLDNYILFDFCEYGANDWDMQETHLWGINSKKFPQTQTHEWEKFDEFVAKKPPLIYFKRELLQKDFKLGIYPIEYPSFHPPYPVQSEKEFNMRPLQVFFCWGHSHESRRVLHGNIFSNAAIKGYGVVDNFNFIDQAKREYKDLWVTIQTPHYARISMEEVLNINGQAKLSVSMPGAGIKCFRHSESPVNSVMVMRNDNLAWSYPWIAGLDCIKFGLPVTKDGIRGVLGQWDAIEVMENWLNHDGLYGIYKKGVEKLDKYRLSNYVNNYLSPIIDLY